MSGMPGAETKADEVVLPGCLATKGWATKTPEPGGVPDPAPCLERELATAFGDKQDIKLKADINEITHGLSIVDYPL